MTFPGRAEMLQVVEAHKRIDIDTLMQSLLERVYKRRLRLKERFVEFDPLRTGAVSVHKFRTALSIAGLDDLSDMEYAALAEAYAGHTPGTVQYVRLINYLEQAFVVPDMERFPTSTVPPLAASSIRKPLPTLGDAQEEEVAALLQRIRRQVTVHRLEVKQPFDDFARGSGLIHRVTRSQFRQVLGRLHIELTNAEAELLCAKLDTHRDGTVNYIEFAVLVDPAVAAALPPALGGTIETATLPLGFRSERVLSLHPDGYQPGRPPVSLDEPRLPAREPPPSSPDAALGALIGRCAEKAATHRLRLHSFFEDKDKLRKNQIALPAFRTALAIAFDRLCIELTESEFELVATRFATTMADGSPAVRWLDFIGAVEASSEPPRGIERDPLFEPVTHAVSASAKLRPPPAGQEALWTSLKARLRKQIAARSLLLRPTFDDFSKSGSARLVDHVTRTQFHQGLLSLGLLVNRAELDLLYHRYDTNRDSTVHYVLFASEMDDYEQFSQRQSTWNAGVGQGGFNKPKTFPPDHALPYGTYVQPGRAEASAEVPRLPSMPTPSVEVAAILADLQRCAKRYGIRCEEFFRDYDRLRSGKMTRSHFRTALRLAFEGRCSLAEAQVQALMTHYAAQPASAGQPTLVRWRDFAADVNGAFVVMGMETQPLATPSELEMGVTLPEVSDAELATVEAVLERFRLAVKQRSLSLRPQMRDFEMSRRSPVMVGRITQAQFRQALTIAGLELTNSEFAALVKRFDTRREGSVDYVQFVHLVDPSEAHTLEPGRTVRSTCGYHQPRVLEPASAFPYQPGRPPVRLDQPRLLEKPSTSVEELVARMRNKCLVLRLRVEDAFRDHDHLNSGCVTVEHFRSAIARAFDTANLALTEEEFGFLVEKYRRSTPAQIAPSGVVAKRPVPPGVLLVDWRLFCADVDPVVTGLEQDPLAVVKPATVERKLKQLSPEREAALAEVLAAVRHRFVTRRVLMKPFFLDFAQSRMKATVADHVTRKQFRQALSTAGIELPADQMDLIYEKFDDSNDLSINYVAFTRAVDPTETYSDRPSEPRQLFTDGYIKPRVILPSQSTRVF